MAAAKTELVHVQQELTGVFVIVNFLASASLMLLPACTARASQLESRVSTLESALGKQEEILVAAQEEMQEKISAADERSIIACPYPFKLLVPQICWTPQCEHSP